MKPDGWLAHLAKLQELETAQQKLRDCFTGPPVNLAFPASCRLLISVLPFPPALHLILSGFPEVVGVPSLWGDCLGLDDMGLVDS